MATNIKLDAIKPDITGYSIDGLKANTRFYPVQRKLQILDD